MNCDVNLSDSWFNQDEIYVKGTAFIGNEMIDNSKLISKIKQVEDSNIDCFLNSLNGFFSIVFAKDNNIWISVDKVRSYPLFYSIQDERLLISDNPRWIKDEIKDKDLNSLSVTEFMLTGFVTGSETHYSQIKQVQAGEVVMLQKDFNNKIQVNSIRYFQYMHHDYFQETESVLFKYFDTHLLNTFNRLVKFANGRTLVIPLSGGYDSRLIALMLKKLDYSNVITYSYGKKENTESQTSKKVAKALGFKWIFVEYTKENWFEWYNSEEMREYIIHADGCCSLPHIQDWPAIKEIKENNMVPEDSIFTPGLSADLPAGSRSFGQVDLYKSLRYDHKKLFNHIINHNYFLFDINRIKRDIVRELKDKIQNNLVIYDDYVETASAYESWDIMERQTKFINNSIRIYEFWGYDWWTPFWDNEFIDFWSRMQLKYRLFKNFYIKYVDNLSNTYFETENTINTVKDKFLKRILVRLLPSFIYPFMQKQRNKILIKTNYNNHFLELSGIWHYNDYKSLIKSGFNTTNGFLIKNYCENYLHLDNKFYERILTTP